MNRTLSASTVAAVLMDTPDDRHWGYDLSRAAGLRSGIVYPILRRFLEAGWLEDGWEDPATIESNRPPRRYYTVTDLGRRELAALAAAGRAKRS